MELDKLRMIRLVYDGGYYSVNKLCLLYGFLYWYCFESGHQLEKTKKKYLGLIKFKIRV